MYSMVNDVSKLSFSSVCIIQTIYYSIIVGIKGENKLKFYQKLIFITVETQK